MQQEITPEKIINSAPVKPVFCKDCVHFERHFHPPGFGLIAMLCGHPKASCKKNAKESRDFEGDIVVEGIEDASVKNKELNCKDYQPFTFWQKVKRRLRGKK